jgi:hypothetical protein
MLGGQKKVTEEQEIRFRAHWLLMLDGSVKMIKSHVLPKAIRTQNITMFSR